MIISPSMTGTIFLSEANSWHTILYMNELIAKNQRVFMTQLGAATYTKQLTTTTVIIEKTSIDNIDLWLAKHRLNDYPESRIVPLHSVLTKTKFRMWTSVPVWPKQSFECERVSSHWFLVKKNTFCAASCASSCSIRFSKNRTLVH